jgi:hypothetical protein
MSTQNAQNWLLLANLVFVAVYVVLTGKLVRWQRKQWKLDSRKQEWSELIGTLTECFQKIEIEFAAPVPNTFAQHTREWVAHQVETPSVRLRAARVIDDRLFIIDVLEKEHVREGWGEIELASYTPISVQQNPPHQAGGSVSVTGLQQKWAAFHRNLVRAAQLDLGIDSAGDHRPR